jgi:hypothetical protein
VQWPMGDPSIVRWIFPSINRSFAG